MVRTQLHNSIQELTSAKSTRPKKFCGRVHKYCPEYEPRYKSYNLGSKYLSLVSNLFSPSYSFFLLRCFWSLLSLFQLHSSLFFLVRIYFILPVNSSYFYTLVSPSFVERHFTSLSFSPNPFCPLALLDCLVYAHC